METIYLALGSNVGNRYENIKKASGALAAYGITVVKNSSLYETLPYGYKDQANFLNIVLKCVTEIEPFTLLTRVKEIEKISGRKETFRWGPREIDIDILLYGNLIINTERLTIPHIDLTKRDFFLTPLIEIDNNIAEPGTNIPLRYFLAKAEPNIINSISVESDFSRIINNQLPDRGLNIIPESNPRQTSFK